MLMRSSRCRPTAVLGIVCLSITAPVLGARAQTAEAPPSGSAASPAPAADAERVVTLRDGAIYRGVVIELVPDDHLILRLATGELRRIAWADIQSQIVVAAPLGLPVTAAGTATAAAAQVPLGRALVHMDSPSPEAELYRSGNLIGRAQNWERICRTPCDTQVDPSARFLVRGEGLMPSASFVLPASARSVTLTVRPRSVARHRAGIALVAVGAAGLSVGLAFLIASPFYDYGVKPTPVLTSTGQLDPFYANAYMLQLKAYNDGLAIYRNWQIGGGVGLALGAGALAGGLGLMLTSRTRVEVEE